jgi:hypothetical protein
VFRYSPAPDRVAGWVRQPLCELFYLQCKQALLASFGGAAIGTRFMPPWELGDGALASLTALVTRLCLLGAL